VVEREAMGYEVHPIHVQTLRSDLCTAAGGGKHAKEHAQ